MLTIRYQTEFRRDIKRLKRRGYDLTLMSKVIEALALDKPLDAKYKDHALIGNYKGYRECHIANDWLLIYKKKANELLLIVARTGTHSDLF